MDISKIKSKKNRALEISVLIIVIIAMIGEWNYEKSMILSNNKEEGQKKYINEIKEKINQKIFQQYSEMPARIVNLPIIKKTISDNKIVINGEVDNVLTGITEVFGVDNVYVMNSTGNVLASKNKDFIGKNYSFRPYFVSAIGGNQNVYVALGVTTGKEGIYISAPIYVNYSDNLADGVVVVKTDVELINEVLSGYKDDIFILSEEGVIFSSNRKDSLFKYAKPISEKKLVEIKKSQQFGIEQLKPFEIMLDKKIVLKEEEVYNVLSVRNQYDWNICLLENIKKEYPLSELQKKFLIENIIFKVILFLIIVHLYNIILRVRKKEHEVSDLLTIIEQSPVSVIITNIEGEIEYVNPVFLKLTGYTKEEVMERNPRFLKSGIQDKNFYDEMWKLLAQGNEWQGEFCNKKKNGEIYWEKATIIPIKDNNLKVIKYLAVKEDITEKKEFENMLNHYATIDEMTGVLNRRTGLVLLENELMIHKRDKKNLVVCFIDINNLKEVNDNFGHDTGDDMIINFVKCVKDSLRESDIIFRMGGDEFLLILQDCSIGSADFVWSRLLENIDIFNKYKKKDYKISASHGFAEYTPDEDQSLDILINTADRNMYLEKKRMKK